MKGKYHLIHLSGSLLASVLFAALIIRSGIVHVLISTTDGFAQVGSFVAGFFCTSMLTIAPSIVVLGQLSVDTSIWSVALIGAVGAVCGDYVLFWIVRDKFSEDVKYLISHATMPMRFKAMWHTRLIHRLLPFIGALIIASPLPDELGLALLGFSNIRKERFFLVMFCMNFIGIYVTGLVARSIAGV
ncbi:MAG: Uncharacterized protein G01um10148_617 [Parcubacteria group bacterium Gr01-1014_8]|nr:MAG: Uncharacterized protein G01um10148_617 [Parcubacteria group bacterium Gr01-1014_8]